MRTVLLVALVALSAVAGAFQVQDTHFGIYTAIPQLSGAGLTFNPQGDLFVYDTQYYGFGCLFKFPNAANQPSFTPIPFSYKSDCASSGGFVVGAGFGSIISTDTGRLYLSNGYEISPVNGTILRRAFNNCGASHGIGRDPRDGALFFSKYENDGLGNRYVYRIENPDNHPAPEIQDTCATPFANPGADANTGIDGLTVGPNGIVYMAGYDASSLLVYSAYSPSTPTGTKIGQSSTGRSAGFGPDGISICYGDGVSFAITADANAQTIHRFNLTGPGGAPTYAVSDLVTSTGGYNDWTAVDPKGCIWGSTINGAGGVWKLSNADGSCMQCSAPQQTNNCNCEHVVTASGTSTTAAASSQGGCVSLQFV